MFAISQHFTLKLQIFPYKKNEPFLLDTMRAYSAACDYISDYMFQNKEIRRPRVQKKLYRKIREKYNLTAQMTCSALNTVHAAYDSILSNQKRWIRATFRKPQLDLIWKRDYSLIMKDILFSISTLDGYVRALYSKKGFKQYLTKEYKFGTAHLIYRDGKFYLYIPVTKEAELPPSQVTNVVGIDRGIRFAAVTYDSTGKTRFFDGKEIIQKHAHFNAVRTSLQKKKTPSARKRFRALAQRENRWMQDKNHCIAKALTGSQPEGTLFVLEDLKGMQKKLRRFRKRGLYHMSSWSYADLEQKITYKAWRNRQWVVKVSPAYTSQKCPVCGHTEKKNRNRKNHLFSCRNCGYRSNDDRVAAMNLHRKGVDLVSRVQQVRGMALYCRYLSACLRCNTSSLRKVG